MKAAIEGVRPNIRTTTIQDIIRVKYSIATLIRINFLIFENSLEMNPKGLGSLNNFVTLVCTSLRIPSILKIFPSTLLEPLEHSFITHSKFMMFWWEDFI